MKQEREKIAKELTKERFQSLHYNYTPAMHPFIKEATQMPVHIIIALCNYASILKIHSKKSP